MTSGEERRERVREIVAQVRTLSGHERAARIDAGCEGDRTLTREVERLLAQEADPGTATRPAGATAAREREDSTHGLLERVSAHSPPQSRYRVQGEIARGGMGTILRVWDEDLRRHLAMKVVLGKGQAEGRGDTPNVPPATLARFLEEAQVTGQLDHPGIVPVHELGLDAHGRVYFTMKLVKGKTLREVFDELDRGEGGWNRTRVVRLILKICEAMAYAHDKGVIHRDLKPSNVMVGRYGEVYVMDWGVAKILGREDHRDLRLREGPPRTSTELESDRHDRVAQEADASLITLDGDVVGTPAYMSVEQARGRVADVGPASDVYSVGALLYRLLAGHPPYVPEGARLNHYAIWQRVQEGPPRSLREVAARAPEELAAICEKAMARALDARYPDMWALAEDLSAYLEGRVVHAYETGAWAEARKWVRRNKPLAAALAAGVLALVVGLVSSRVQKARADANAARAAANEALARQETAKVLRLSDVKRLQELELEADALWPAHPDRIPELEDWLVRAQRLASNLPAHRATLAHTRAAALPEAQDGSSAEVGPARAWRFESAEEQWQHDVLEELVVGLERLQSGLLAEEATTADHGWSVPKRLGFAQRLREGFAEGGVHARAWEQALADIHAEYPLLELTPQLGLVPIGVDAESGLWEFAHLMTGAPARRGPDGELAVEEESGLVLVLLRGGTFWMGAQSLDPDGRNYDPQAQADEGPVHRVELSPFFLSKYELTQAQWKRLTGRNPSYHHDSTLVPSLTNPVEQVSWQDCRTWLQRAGLLLPSEAQWEYGARGWSDTPWWTGERRESLREARAANLADQAAARAGGSWQGIRDWPDLDDGFGVHAPVGSFAANGFGLHEVAGNVWEWTLDGSDPEYYLRSPELDPVAPIEGADARMYRGGAYNESAAYARSANREAYAPSLASSFLGVRPARAIAP